MAASRGEKGQVRPFSTRDPTCDSCRVKKIRCGRERPICHNCDKVGTACTWSGYGKRPNQTAKTNRELGNIKERVQQLEDSLDRLLDIISQMRTSSGSIQYAVSDSYLDRKLLDGTKVRQDFLNFVTATPSSISPLTVSHFMFNLKAHIQPQPTTNYSTPSPSSDNVNSLNQNLQFPLQLSGESLDQGPVLKPPVSMMKTFLDSYFNDINPLFPIFSRKALEARIEKAYAPQAGVTDLADAVSFNSILLLVLLSNALKSASEYAGLNLTLSPESVIETNLMETFRTNLFKAMRCSDHLLVPCIENVQALMSLALVVQQYSYIGESERLLDTANCLAQQLLTREIEGDESSLNELRIVCRSLDLIRARCTHSNYVQASFNHCRSPEFISANVLEGYLEHQHNVANSSAVLWATLVEQSSKDHQFDFGIISSAFADLQLHFQRAEAFHQATISPPQSEEDAHLCRLAFNEIELHFLATRLLIRWSPAKDRVTRNAIAADAIKSIKILLNMWKDTRSTSSQSVLIRCLSSPVPYAAISKLVIEATKLKQIEDLQLLEGLTQMVQSIAAFVPQAHVVHQLGCLLNSSSQPRMPHLRTRSLPINASAPALLVNGTSTHTPSPPPKGELSLNPQLPRSESLPTLSHIPSQSSSSSLYYDFDMDDTLDISSAAAGSGSVHGETSNLFSFLDTDMSLGMDFDVNDIDGFTMVPTT